MGWLNRMTQWKDKAGKNREGASVALFDYPVLQAADILLYRATHVPVGEDQKQHVELTRDIALKFNTDFDTDLFVVPEPFIGGGTAARVMSLRDGQAKMSKSDPSEMSRVNLTDSDDEIAQKIRKAKTDPEPLPDDSAALDGRPEARNLVGIYGAVTGEEVSQVLARFAGQGFGTFKPALADALIALIAPIRERLDDLRRHPAELDRILAEGAARAASCRAGARSREDGRRADPIAFAAGLDHGPPTVRAPVPLSRRLAKSSKRRAGPPDLHRTGGQAHSRAWGGLLFIFAAINVLPLPPGTSVFFAIPLMIVSAQMVLGRTSPWFPNRIDRRGVTKEELSGSSARCEWLELRVERMLKPRLPAAHRTDGGPPHRRGLSGACAGCGNPHSAVPHRPRGSDRAVRPRAHLS